MIGNLGWPELLLIAFAILVLFGAKRLPEIGQSLGKGIREFKNSLTSAEEEPKIGPGDEHRREAERPPRREEAR